MNLHPKETLDRMLRLMGFEVTVTATDEESGVVLNIDTDDPGRLIGRQGQTLSHLQYILNRILHRQDTEAAHVRLDVGNYRNKTRQTITDKALKAAQLSSRWKDLIEMEPMNAFERKIVYDTLKDHEDIVLRSVEVEGTSKKVILIKPSS